MNGRAARQSEKRNNRKKRWLNGEGEQTAEYVVQIKEQVKCVDLYFTFRKLLHCITCGYQDSSSWSSLGRSVAPNRGLARVDEKRFVSRMKINMRT